MVELDEAKETEGPKLRQNLFLKKLSSCQSGVVDGEENIMGFFRYARDEFEQLLVSTNGLINALTTHFPAA